MSENIQDIFKKWDNGKHTFDPIGEKLLNLQAGEKIGNILSESTICPVGNSTCSHYIRVFIYGFHPNGGIEKEIWICSYGCSTKNCLLNLFLLCARSVDSEGERAANDAMQAIFRVFYWPMGLFSRKCRGWVDIFCYVHKIYLHMIF